MKTRKYKTRSIDTIDWKVESDVEGVISEFGLLKVEEDERPFMIIDTGQQLVRVFHSKALEDAFEQGEVGDHISIQFRGKVKLQGGKTFNRFNVQVWTEEGEDEKEESPSVQ